jgi:predicted metal-dependent phosphoesterase TrpH
MLKVDLHTHSVASSDGGLNAKHYRWALEEGLLDYIAITDHNTVDFALEQRASLGERIIVGEEVMTDAGEIIGLYLQRTIPHGLALADAIAAIQAQHGLVYIPHPFETKRKGLGADELQRIAGSVDIIETFNGRAWAGPRSNQASDWAIKQHKASATASDAHGRYGWGRTYTFLAEAPERGTLLGLLDQAQLVTKGPVLLAALYPAMNRLRQRITRAS